MVEINFYSPFIFLISLRILNILKILNILINWSPAPEFNWKLRFVIINSTALDITTKKSNLLLIK